MWSPGTTVVGTFLLTFPVPETINKIKMKLVACIEFDMTKINRYMNVLHSRSKQLDVKILIIIKKDQVTTIPCLTTTSLPGSNLSTVTSILSSSEMFQGVVID